MKTVEQLADELREAAYIAAAGTVGPGRNLQTVYRRLSEVDFMFIEFASVILTGKKGPPVHANESTDEALRPVVQVPCRLRPSLPARDRGVAAAESRGHGEADAGTA